MGSMNVEPYILCDCVPSSSCSRGSRNNMLLRVATGVNLLVHVSVHVCLIVPQNGWHPRDAPGIVCNALPSPPAYLQAFMHLSPQHSRSCTAACDCWQLSGSSLDKWMSMGTRSAKPQTCITCQGGSERGGAALEEGHGGANTNMHVKHA